MLTKYLDMIHVWIYTDFRESLEEVSPSITFLWYSQCALLI